LEKLLEQKDLDLKIADEYKTVMAQADALSVADMGLALKKYGVKAPDTGNDLGDPEPFNLMFATSIGPTGHIPG
jgi:glycyl-tRNA synthetase